MCNCMNEMLGKVSERVQEGLPSNADKNTFDIKYQNKVLRLDGRGNNVMIGVDYSYYKIKKDGERAKIRSKNSVGLAMSYCPFCGKKYDEAKKAGE